MSEYIYSIDELNNLIRPILNKYRAEKALLFGSYARKEATPDSDIDLMVIGGKDFDPTDIFCIADELYDYSNKKVDVYEQREINADSEFYKTILREGVLII